MKRAERQRWFDLTMEHTSGPWDCALCSLCRYFYDVGGDVDCTHDLDAVSNWGRLLNMGRGKDCWGFRPRVPWARAREYLALKGYSTAR